MYAPNTLARLTLLAVRGSTFTSEQRATLVRLLPRTSGMMWCLVTLALRHYSVEVA